MLTLSHSDFYQKSFIPDSEAGHFPLLTSLGSLLMAIGSSFGKLQNIFPFFFPPFLSVYSHDGQMGCDSLLYEVTHKFQISLGSVILQQHEG